MTRIITFISIKPRADKTLWSWSWSLLLQTSGIVYSYAPCFAILELDDLKIGAP